MVQLSHVITDVRKIYPVKSLVSHEKNVRIYMCDKRLRCASVMCCTKCENETNI